MPRKHFQAIAEAVYKMSLTAEQRQHVAVLLANALCEQNDKFDYDRFVTACMKGE
jgi:hypothetical protein